MARSNPAAPQADIDGELLGELLADGRKTCTYTVKADSLPPPQRAAIEAAIQAGVSRSTLARRLGQRGIMRISPETLGKHMDGICGCPRPTPS